MPDPAVPPTPPVPLAALLAREDLALRQIAGPVDPAAVIHWAHTSEMADPYPYLLGGELLLTAGVHVPEAAGSGAYFDDYVSRIVAAGGAALGFGLAPVHDTVPRALVAACEAYELPLIEVPPQTTFSGVARAVWQLMAQARLAELRRVTEAQQSLAAAASRPDPIPSVLRQLAQRVGGRAVLYGPEGTEIAGAGRLPGSGAAGRPAAGAGRPAGSPTANQPAANAGQSTGSPAAGQPAADTPRSAGSRTANQPAASAGRSAGSPAAGQPAADTPRSAGSPTANQPAASAGRSAGSPAAGQPAADTPRSAGSPTANQPAASAGRSAGSPAAGQPAADTPRSAGSPTANQPAASAGRSAGSPAAGQPAADTPRSAGSPTANQPAASAGRSVGSPAAGQPAADATAGRPADGTAPGGPPEAATPPALAELAQVVRPSGPGTPTSATHTVAGVHLAAYALGAGQGFVLGVAAPARDPGDHTIASVAAVLLSLLTGEHQSGSGAARSSALVRLLLGAGPEEVAPLLGGAPWFVVHAAPDGQSSDAVAASALGAALGSPLVDLGEDVVRVLADRAPDPHPGWTLGVSSPVEPHDWTLADTQAARALARARATRSALVRHGGRPGLAALIAPDEAEAHARALLAPLAGSPALRDTLRTWLSLHGSWDRTAVALAVHRNTVRQRIAKCAALLDADLDDPDVRMELWFALRE
ncbi:PucR-like helix-turn-helix protein [Streptomyces sp. TLI_55]|uniref:PucR family transcriptional regulator ligand-binding domain-containing protein n=1 Tax=Streptomyces sp. TLI_55 TaxID=1938861 RepID=UPI000BCAB19F|nr:PucR family transcriptional regulator ligand-binding domain-containing protein [Streptomyces sp. TLI_55]SNX59559.1 PucR-like helix-turn-helix protein [Streptomyces sp. TLI_55]